MKIDYLGHSGFLVGTGKAVLLFDYYRGDISLIRQTAANKPLYVFVSHAHADHFNPKIFSLTKGGRRVKYILSFDIKGNPKVPEDCDISYLEADKTYTVDGLGTVQTLTSTDEGVAFLVKTKDMTLFHAGDLNWWDWPGEDPDWLADQKNVFQREIRKLAGISIDAACVVLDDRLEENYAEGLAYFLSVCSARYVLPMHFWKDKTVVDRFKQLPKAWKPDTVLLDTAEEQHWEIERKK